MKTRIFQFIGISVVFSATAALFTTVWGLSEVPQWFHAVHLPSVLGCVAATLSVAATAPAGKS